jgi:hypothetical protein
MGKFYVIRAFARPSSTLLYLQVGAVTGKTRFIAKNARSRQVEKIDLSVVATPEVLTEIGAKSNWNVRYGHALQTVLVSDAVKECINACWAELKSLRPQFCIRELRNT